MKKILKMFVIIAAVMIPSAVANAQPKKKNAQINGFLFMDGDTCKWIHNGYEVQNVVDVSDDEIETLIKGNRKQCVIGNELKLAKEYMVQIAKKSTGEFMENENIIYKDSECEKHAKIPSSKMESVMSITTVPQSTRSVVVKLLIEKMGKPLFLSYNNLETLHLLNA